MASGALYHHISFGRLEPLGPGQETSVASSELSTSEMSSASPGAMRKLKKDRQWRAVAKTPYKGIIL